MGGGWGLWVAQKQVLYKGMELITGGPGGVWTTPLKAKPVLLNVHNMHKYLTKKYGTLVFDQKLSGEGDSKLFFLFFMYLGANHNLWIQGQSQHIWPQ